MPSSISSLSHKLYEVVNEALNFFIREINCENQREIDEYESLMRLSFDLKKNSQFSDDFPVWRYGQKDKTFLFGSYTHDNRLIACLGLRICEIKLFNPNDPLVNPHKNDHKNADNTRTETNQIGIIGSVATHPDFRKKGLASMLLKHSETLAKQSSVNQLFIWGSDDRLYTKNRYIREGLQRQVRFNLPKKDVTIIPKGYSIEITRSLKQSHFDYLCSLDRPGLILEQSDYMWLSRHRNIDWFFLRKDDQNKTVIAHAAINKGIDLPGYIHDFGSSAASFDNGIGNQILGIDPLNLILANVVERYPYAELLIHPNDLHRIHLEHHANESEPSALFLTKSLGAKLDINRVWFWGTQSA